MAKMVGSHGRVIAVDIQEKMLAHVRKKAHRHGVADRVCLLVGAQESGLNASEAGTAETFKCYTAVWRECRERYFSLCYKSDTVAFHKIVEHDFISG
jgi:ubiquinone/menaquinone biosynthesis C-methylase UbiE